MTAQSLNLILFFSSIPGNSRQVILDVGVGVAGTSPDLMDEAFCGLYPTLETAPPFYCQDQ